MSLFWDDGLPESILPGGCFNCGGCAPHARGSYPGDAGTADALTLWITASWQLRLKGLRGSYPGDGVSERPHPVCNRIATVAH